MKFSEMIYTRPDPAEVKSALAELTERLRAAKDQINATEETNDENPAAR